MFGPKLVSMIILISGIPIRDFHKVVKIHNIVIKYKTQSIKNQDEVMESNRKEKCQGKERMQR